MTWDRKRTHNHRGGEGNLFPGRQGPDDLGANGGVIGIVLDNRAKCLEDVVIAAVRRQIPHRLQTCGRRTGGIHHLSRPSANTAKSAG